MKIRHLNLFHIIVIAFVIIGFNIYAETPFINLSDDLLSSTISEGNHEISIMEISIEPNELEKINNLTEKIKQSISLDMKWYQEYIEKYTGKELPWHENFGLSLDEYNYILNSDKLMKLLEKKKSIIEMRKNDSGDFILFENPDLPYLSDLTFYINENILSNYLGIFEYDSDIEASDDQKITGRWNGSTWTLMFSELQDIENMNEDEAYGSITISIGQLEESKKIIIYYKERVILNNEGYTGEEIIIFK